LNDKDNFIRQQVNRRSDEKLRVLFNRHPINQFEILPQALLDLMPSNSLIEAAFFKIATISLSPN